MENKTIDTNISIMLGRLTRDPEFSHAGDKNTPLCKFSIACNNGLKGADFFDIEMWGKLAETCNEYITKGSQILVTGRLYKSSWKDKETLKTRSKIILKAFNVQFINSKKDGEQSNPQPKLSADEIEEKKFANVDFNNPDSEEIPF